MLLGGLWGRTPPTRGRPRPLTGPRRFTAPLPRRLPPRVGAAGSPVALRGWTDFHIKGTTAELPETAYKSAPEVVCVYLPLAAVLIPRWLGVVRSFGTPCALWLYLVSGSGTPHNPDHPVTGNSTVAVSGLIDSFVRRVAPEVTVQRIHSGPGVFRYHDNVTFVNKKLQVRPADATAPTATHPPPAAQPVVERHHREMCSTGDEEWHKRIHIKMTLADGATARVTALTHAMRRYRPDFFHVWQLKSFWHYQRVDELDVDFIRFSRVDTMPPVLRDSLSADARLLVDEMRAFYASFQAAASHVDGARAYARPRGARCGARAHATLPPRRHRARAVLAAQDTQARAGGPAGAEAARRGAAPLPRHQHGGGFQRPPPTPTPTPPAAEEERGGEEGGAPP